MDDLIRRSKPSLPVAIDYVEGTRCTRVVCFIDKVIDFDRLVVEDVARRKLTLEFVGNPTAVRSITQADGHTQIYYNPMIPEN